MRGGLAGDLPDLPRQQRGAGRAVLRHVRPRPRRLPQGPGGGAQSLPAHGREGRVLGIPGEVPLLQREVHLRRW